MRRAHLLGRTPKTEAAVRVLPLGLRKDSTYATPGGRLAWRLLNLRDDLLVDGFIQWVVGGWIRRFVTEGTTFLELGCGDMSLSKYVSPAVPYTGLDLSLSEVHVRRTKRRRDSVNLVIGTMTDLPFASNSASLIVSTQVMEYVGAIDRAITEIHRVAKPGAKFICTIANGYCHKYDAKGVHWGHVNHWSFGGFVKLMSANGFRAVTSQQRGLWIPLPTCLTLTSYQLPIQCTNEYYNGYFLFAFEVVK